MHIDRVTPVVIDCTANWRRGLKALKISLNKCSFDDAIFFGSRPLAEIELDLLGISLRYIKISPIRDKERYSEFCIRELHSYIDTDFLLIVQWDGYVLKADSWLPEFLDYDYIGAPWNFHKEHVVGNGGFSLRSKRLMQFVSILEGCPHPEDVAICRGPWRELIDNAGFKIAPFEVAKKFASESYPYEGQFGWHGGCAPVH